MQLRWMMRLARIMPVVLCLFGPKTVLAEGDLNKVNHIIIITQENHSFDNYFGALAYAPGSPYHNADRDADGDRDDRGCSSNDHRCVDGLSCIQDHSGNLTCLNSNIDNAGHTILSFHDSRRCVVPDLDHGWVGTHNEANFEFPNNTLHDTLSDGFVRQNQDTEQLNNLDQTMNFYNQDEIPFYYNLAENFALDDRYFCPALGPTFVNRSYLMAATSFGHLTTSETFPPAGGYKPITGTIFDLLDKNSITWADYFQDLPQGGSFRPFPSDPHLLPLTLFLAQAAGKPGAGPLPSVSFIDPNFGILAFSLRTMNILRLISREGRPTFRR